MRVPVPRPLASTALARWTRTVEAHYARREKERLHRRAPVDAIRLEHPEIRAALLALFHGKCAYCETPAYEQGNAHVAHHRPTSNAAQAPGDADSPDHYGWLALEWRNLLLLCAKCSYAKSNLFPVARDRAPPLTPWEGLSREAPLLLDPCVDSPSSHLAFDRDGHAVARTSRGAATIEILHLNRTELVQARTDALSGLLHDLTRDTDRLNLVQTLRRVTAGSAPFAGVLTIFLNQVHRAASRRMPRRDITNGYNLHSRLGALWERLSNADWHVSIGEALEVAAPGALSWQRRAWRQPVARAERAPIESISIRAFKGIGALDLTLRNVDTVAGRAPCMMLLGENASGKSSVLQAIGFALLDDAAWKRLGIPLERIASGRAGEQRDAVAQGITTSLQFADGTRLSKHWSPFAVAPGESSIGEADDPVLLAYGAHRIMEPEDKPNRRGPTSIASLFDPFRPLPHPASWLAGLDDSRFHAVARALRVVLSLDHEDDIFKDTNNRVWVRAGGRSTPLDQLSDGYKSLLAMAVDIMRNLLANRLDLEYARGVVLIDEIENHLHPRWKMRVMSALREAMPKVQFIVTTHDPLCLRGMHPGEVKVVFNDGESNVGVMEDLPDVSTLRVDQLLTSDFFGLATATDPERDRMVRELAGLAGIPESELAPAQAARRDEILAQAFVLPVIGSSVDRQIVAEAVTRHVREEQVTRPLQRRLAREQSVQKILDVLRRSSRE